MPMAASLVHTPEKSGSPHAVFAPVKVFADAGGFAGACADRTANDPQTNAVESITTNAKALWDMASSGFRVQGSGFRVQGSGFRVQSSIYSTIACHTAFSKSRCSGPLAPCIMIMDTIFSFGSMF